jgi:hypothetical protein
MRQPMYYEPDESCTTLIPRQCEADILLLVEDQRSDIGPKPGHIVRLMHVHLI